MYVIFVLKYGRVYFYFLKATINNSEKQRIHIFVFAIVHIYQYLVKLQKKFSFKQKSSRNIYKKLYKFSCFLPYFFGRDKPCALLQYAYFLQV